ncbi:transposase [Sedimentitalea sp. XS_ASV28]|uniref:IS66-like element accessory protein TnpA n=1 Tax=Sedimentitalea sp. XS_ASV28 TaxID=3241296 RepID=UPI003512D1D5
MDGYLDGSTDGYAGRIEVIEGRGGRRLRSEAERARIAAESLVPGAKVADVARRHGVTRWQVYDWRKKLKSGDLAVPAEAMQEPMFAALVVEQPAPTSPTPDRKSRGETRSSRIELVVDGVTVRVGADVDEALLTQVIRAVRAAGA